MSPSELLSIVIGWTYFAAWSISFYPQAILNYRRRSVEGLSFDFLYLNLWGFICYSIFNVSFYASDLVRRQYREKWGSDNVVQLNDVFFGLHACLLTLITIGQTFYYPRAATQRVADWVKTFILVTSFGAAVLAVNMWIGSTKALDVVYYLSYVKMGITIIKYTPQAYMNFQRKSTAGWSIHNILLDFTGGFLSFLQQGIDSSANNDWSGIWGNPVKLGLGLFSMGFDVLFMVQHYVLYPEKGRTDEEALLAGGRDD